MKGTDIEPNCVFCKIVAREAPAEIVHETTGTMTIVPLNPVTPGHLIVIPKLHLTDALESPAHTGMVMSWAAAQAEAPCNIITSVGAEATQTVFHLHVHIVPRSEGDGLHLPWTGQKR